MAQTALKGNPVNLAGDLPAVGTTAPDFKLVAGDLCDVSLANYAGKKKLLNIVPSLDTAGLRHLDQEVQRGDGRQGRRRGPGDLRRPALRLRAASAARKGSATSSPSP